jgi:hypothetical protein
MFASYHDRMNPDSAYSDYVGYYWDGEWIEFERIVHEQLYHMDPDVKHPYLEQFTVGLERELFKDSSLSISYIYRNWKNIMGPIDRAGNYEPYALTVPDYGDYTIYERTAETVNTFDYLITNLDKAYSQGYPWILMNPYRRYQGVEFLFNKRFSNRWQLLASYTLSKAYGTTDNGQADDIGWGGTVYDPNFWINADGHSTYDSTNMIKIQGSYIIPKIELSVSVYYHGVTGNSWTARYRTPRLNQGRVTFFLEKRGSNHYPMDHQLDVRLEKIFTFASKYKLGIMLDVFNVFNSDTIYSWGTRWDYDWYTPDVYPSTDGHELLGIVNPRQARLGIRLIF